MYAVGLGLALLSLLVPAAFAAEPLAKGIQDNSFLIEEAYNQEAGHVQHILNLRRQGQQWQFSFSREWPIRSQTHQFSYTLPYNFGSGPGPGDVTVSYRYQLQTETDTRPAIARPASVWCCRRPIRSRPTGCSRRAKNLNATSSCCPSARS